MPARDERGASTRAGLGETSGAVSPATGPASRCGVGRAADRRRRSVDDRDGSGSTSSVRIQSGEAR